MKTKVTCVAACEIVNFVNFAKSSHLYKSVNINSVVDLVLSEDVRLIKI